MQASLRDRAILIHYKAHETIEDRELLVKSLFTLFLVLCGFIFGHGHGYEPGTVALAGAAFLMLLDDYKFKPEEQSHRVQSVLGSVEWETIFFFLGLFILVYGVEQAGLLSILGSKLLDFTGGDLQATGIVVIWSSAILSAIVDNIPFVATMIPLIESTAPTFGGPQGLMPLWWCLSLGACLGGNGSLVGASANVMVASYAERAGHRISFMKFMLLGFPLMIGTIAIATVYAWFMFLT